LLKIKQSGREGGFEELEIKKIINIISKRMIDLISPN